jgi:competence protein ComEA
MATIEITAGPTGPARADQMASESGGGGRVATPAVPDADSRFAGRLRQRWAAWNSSVWLPLALRGAAIGLGMLGLAGIGAVSILNGLDGRTRIDVPERADIHAAWVATQQELGGARAREPPEQGIEHGAAALREPGAPATVDGGAPSTPSQPGVTADGKVILNAASADELTRLPGVGQRRAEAIVELRTRLKRFRRVQDLLRVKGIGPRSLKRLMPHMVLDPPLPTPAAGDGGR